MRDDMHNLQTKLELLAELMDTPSQIAEHNMGTVSDRVSLSTNDNL